MQSLLSPSCQPHHHAHPAEQKSLLGHRRGQSDLARISLDLTWARAEFEQAARAKDYPSPPMSGSPPLPPKPTHEAGGWSQRSSSSGGGGSGNTSSIASNRQHVTSHNVYHGSAPMTSTTGTATSSHGGVDVRLQHTSQATSYPHYPYRPQQHQPQQHQQHQQHQHPSLSTPPSHPRPYHTPYGSSDEPSAPRSLSSPSYLPPPPGQAMPAYAHHSYMQPLPGPESMQQGYPISTSNLTHQAPSPIPASSSVPPGSSEALQPYGSPKSQRKTKGHVASACVPCKRAHLRCDAQRPCSRCLTNGKEDACIDVQHKKRGRPRLREERDLRYDLSGRGEPSGQPTGPSARGPMPFSYGPSAVSVGSGFGVSTRRGHSSPYRVLKSQSADYVAPRFIERGFLSDANIYPAPLTISTHVPAPVAYLTMDLEISKASGTFADAIGRRDVTGSSLADMVLALDRAKVQSLQRQMQEERNRKDPQYLPPIFPGRDRERMLQSLGFLPEDIARFALNWQEYLTFTTQDGQHRSFPVRLGLAKQDSLYFVVLLLQVDMRHYGHPTPSPHGRDMPFSYPPFQPMPPQHQAPVFSHPTPLSATFEANRPPMSGEAGYPSNRHSHPSPLGASTPGLSPGIHSAYASSPGHSEYPAGSSSFHTPRSELGRSNQPPPSNYQLPPIRGRHDMRSFEHSTTRDEKTRVDIGGLIDKPDPSHRRPSY